MSLWFTVVLQPLSLKYIFYRQFNAFICLFFMNEKYQLPISNVFTNWKPIKYLT